MGKGPEYVAEFDLAKLKPNEANPRTIDDAGRKQIAASLAEFGHVQPIVANLRGKVYEVVSGHQRLAAALAAGQSLGPVTVVRLSPVQARKLALILNGHAGTFDQAALEAEVRALAAEGVDLTELGLGGEDGFEAALRKIAEESDVAVDTDAVPATRPEAVTQPGELFALGPHRLLCGDSTSAADWQVLMGGDEGDAVMTDPPYGVNYIGKTKDVLLVENDTPEGLSLLLEGALGNALKYCRQGGAWYVAGPAGPLHQVFGDWLIRHEVWRSTIVWYKDSMVLGHGDYHYQHECIFYGWKPGAPHRPPPDRKQVSVWEVPRPKRSEEHPTMKPVALYEKMMLNSTLPGALILEPFGGSGTTLIAAAETKRVCRAIEVSPHYCDVIRRRWTQYAAAKGIDPGTGGLE